MGIIGVAVVGNAMPADDTPKGQHVQIEKGGAEDRALGDATRNRECLGIDNPQGDTLGSLR